MELANYIDHTILKPEAQKDEIIKVCNEAIEHGFYSVCINSCYVPLVKTILENTNVKITSVVGFPLGSMDINAKAFEAKIAVQNGADEIDMVINIGALKNKDYEYVYNDIRKVVEEIYENTVLKVIIETCLLTDEEKKIACRISKEAGANFVKTSTGFSHQGANIEDVKLMRSIVGNEMGVKASGGIRNREIAMQMIEAGASRIGASASVSIVSNHNYKNSGY